MPKMQGGRNWGGRGGTGPPSFLDLCSKNFEISQDILFSFLRAPHKKFASVHPGLSSGETKWPTVIVIVIVAPKLSFDPSSSKTRQKH